MTPCDDFLPAFAPQNPALSGDRYGWDDCTAFAGAMAASFDTCGALVMRGGQIRAESSEPIPDPASPGLNLGQVDDVLRRHGVDLDVRYRMPWLDFAAAVDAGRGAILQINTGPFLGTTWQTTRTAIGHALFVPPGWGVMDSAADGRHAWVHKYDGSRYPKALLRVAAGDLLLRTGRLGAGLVYAALTRDRRSDWRVDVQTDPGPTVLRVYETGVTDGLTRITGRHLAAVTPFEASCSAPVRLLWPARHISRRVVQLTSGPRRGKWIDAYWSHEVQS